MWTWIEWLERLPVAARTALFWGAVLPSLYVSLIAFFRGVRVLFIGTYKTVKKPSRSPH